MLSYSGWFPALGVRVTGKVGPGGSVHIGQFELPPKMESTNPAAGAQFSTTTTPEFSEACSHPSHALQDSPKKERKLETKYEKDPECA
jgi:hypothetical protein